MQNKYIVVLACHYLLDGHTFWNHSLHNTSDLSRGGLAVERFQDNTRRMIEFSVLRSCAYGSPGDEMRLFLTEDGYQAALLSQQRREIKIKRYARIIEGHILDFKPDKRRRHS